MVIHDPAETALLEVLAAPGPFAEHADTLALFGQFVGSWDVEATYFNADGTTRAERRGEWHFGWVLQGRAIQDVLISPPLDHIRAGAPVAEYGTTVRFYDPRSDTWQVTWSAPVAGGTVHLVGRAVADGILLEGRLPTGRLCRWTFSEITADAFVWRGHESSDEGRTWFLDERMLVRRRLTQPAVRNGG
jgi:hypothetical protein